MTVGVSTCEECGTEFHASRADASYCSSACRQRAYRSRNRSPVTDRPATAVTAGVTGKPSIDLLTLGAWEDTARYVVNELQKLEDKTVPVGGWGGTPLSDVVVEPGKPEAELSITREDLMTIATLLHGLTSVADAYDVRLPENWDDITYRAEQEHLRNLHVHQAIGFSTEEEAKNLIEQLRQHIKDLKRQNR